MFENSLYTIDELKSRPTYFNKKHDRQAEAHWLRLDAEIERCMRERPTTVYVRQHWTSTGEPDCGKAKLVLRYRTKFPPQLAAFMSPAEFADMMEELDAASYDGCTSKCCALTAFILLFYLTIFGIFFWMCGEYRANRRGRKAALAKKKGVLAVWNGILAPRGVRVVPRYNLEVQEDDDKPIAAASGEGLLDIPFLCFHLPYPMPPTAAYPQQLPQQMPQHMAMAMAHAGYPYAWPGGPGPQPQYAPGAWPPAGGAGGQPQPLFQVAPGDASGNGKEKEKELVLASGAGYAYPGGNPGPAVTASAPPATFAQGPSPMLPSAAPAAAAAPAAPGAPPPPYAAYAYQPQQAPPPYNSMDPV